MKFSSRFPLAVIVGLCPALWAQPKPSAATSAAAAAPPGSTDNPVVLDSDDSAPNKPAALGEFLRPGVGVGGAAAGIAGANRETTGPVSVLCFKDPDQKALSETTEDVAVLAFLLSRNLEQAFAGEASEYKLGIPMLLTSGKQAVGASYIQGFGTILKMQVRFPVVAPPEGVEQARPDKTASEWEEAKRELLADENGETSLWAPRAEVYTRGQKEGRGYDEKLVLTLKKRVLLLLKNAANLRHVDGSEWIIVKIVGTPNPGKVVKLARVNERNFEGADSPESSPPATPEDPGAANSVPGKKSHKHSNNNTTRSATTVVENVQISSRPTIMTLRVKKAAADALASGKLSEDQFISQAEVAAYLNPAPPNPRITSFPDTAGY